MRRRETGLQSLACRRNQYYKKGLPACAIFFDRFLFRKKLIMISGGHESTRNIALKKN